MVGEGKGGEGGGKAESIPRRVRIRERQSFRHAKGNGDVRARHGPARNRKDISQGGGWTWPLRLIYFDTLRSTQSRAIALELSRNRKFSPKRGACVTSRW